MNKDRTTLFRIPQLRLPLGHTPEDLGRKIARLLGVGAADLVGYSIERKSFDARDRNDIKVVYSIAAELAGEPARTPTGSVASRMTREAGYAFPAGARPLETRPLIVGCGPAGLFCALALAENGYRPIVLERGDDVDSRSRAVAAFLEAGVLDPESNVQFGEGGAGTYSDGKLNTTVTDDSARNRKVLEEFVEAGAPPEIRYSNKPHIGTDYLVKVVKALRRKIESLGGEVRFRSRVDSLVVSGGRVTGVVLADGTRLDSGVVVLAIGHSARDTFRYLAEAGVSMERKPFAIGLRIEHPQEMVSRRQYGETWKHPDLPVADYKLTYRSSTGRGVYTFCMCPGGYVVNSSSEAGLVACNGMSDFARNSRNANSAVVVTVHPEDFACGVAASGASSAAGDVLDGVEFQRRWERLAFEAGHGGYELPVETFADFAAGRKPSALGGVEPAIKGRYVLADLNACLPGFVSDAIKEAIPDFDRKLRGFGRPDAVLAGVETRTSSPLRILRGDDLQSPLSGLYPCGEGAGYSGGIMSSAIDGIRVAEAIALSDRP
jgi:uncharacterized FAD-dependent dehydrogenase